MKVKFEKMGEERSGEGANGTWNVKQIVATTVGEYPNLVVFDVFNDKVDTSKLIPGNEYDISFNAKSREYNNKYYTNLDAWKIEADEAPTPTPVESDGIGGQDLPF